MNGINYVNDFLNENGNSSSSSSSSISSSSMEEGIVLNHALNILSQVFGWTYFILWTIAFYPQIYLNWKKKSIKGLSFDCVALNLCGYIAYSIYNCCFLWSDEIHKEYFKLHASSTQIPVAINDAVFALHGFFFIFVVVLQIFIYGSEGQSMTMPTIVGLAIGSVSVIVVTIVAACGKIMWIYVLYYLSICKFVITVVKFSPQVYMNWKNKNTKGWAIEQVFPDLGGAIFSFLQMVVVSINTHDWNTYFGNPIKMFLSVLTLAYDSIFLIQHFIVYRKNNKLLDLKAQYTAIINDEYDEDDENIDKIIDYGNENTSINKAREDQASLNNFY